MGSSRNCLDGEPLSRRWRPSAGAFAALQETGLLVAEGGDGYHLERPEHKVDVTRTDAHRRWHNRYQTPDFLRTCLTAQL